MLQSPGGSPVKEGIFQRISVRGPFFEASKRIVTPSCDHGIMQGAQADDLRATILVKMAAHGVADGIPKRVQSVGLGEDVVAERPREVAPSGASSTAKMISLDGLVMADTIAAVAPPAPATLRAFASAPD
jgi:hypothetical protein